MRWPLALLGGCLALGFIGGCSAYVGDYDYVPRPALAQVAPEPPDKTPPATAVVCVVGVRREDQKAGIPLSVELRLRLDNNGNKPVAFDPNSMQLSNSQLLVFGPPLVQPPQPMVLEPMQSLLVEAHFPFPPGHSYDNMDLDSLELRWQIKVGDQVVGQGAEFHRMVWPYYNYGPYWDYPPVWWGGYGGAVVIRGR
jgi:hypothetical protein